MEHDIHSLIEERIAAEEARTLDPAVREDRLRPRPARGAECHNCGAVNRDGDLDETFGWYTCWNCGVPFTA
ncbi:MAG: hypothetical protein D6E12_16405 [Desulfovibrio sp.]|nr:MAG: hypothetical protein D6E12_16405 [Desulfovibrio sp.]